MKRNFLLSLLLIVLAWNAAVAQEKPELFSRIEKTFKQKEHAWTVSRIIDGQTLEPLHQSIVLQNGKQQAAVEVTIWKRPEDAHDAFVGLAVAFDNIRGRKVVKRRLANLGDENYMWTNPGSIAWPMIKFRQGNVYVTVYAPSVSIAKRFVRHIVENIEASR